MNGARIRKELNRSMYHVLMVLLSLVVIYPFIWSFLSSFKTVQQLYVDNPLGLIPDPFTLDNYARLFEVLPFGRFLINSIVLSVLIPLLMIAVASLAAYSLARFEYRGRDVLLIAFIATIMIPGHVTLIPNYKIIVDMNLNNTYFALILVDVFTGANAFNIFFFRQYFLSFPRDLENAAIIDGCSRLGVFFRIMMPNARPAIATTAILSFRGVWNAFLWPMLVLNDYDKLTLTVGLKYLKEFEANWAVLLAGSSLSIIPVVIVFLVLQKQFMSSMIGSAFGGK